MLALRVVALFCLASAIYALRCHQTTMGQSVDQPPTTTAMECNPTNALTCLKSVNMQTRSYSKSCGYTTNCTHPSGTGGTNLPATCFNTSTFGMESYSCCCYGDGCNSAPRSSLFFAGATILSMAFF